KHIVGRLFRQRSSLIFFLSPQKKLLLTFIYHKSASQFRYSNHKFIHTLFRHTCHLPMTTKNYAFLILLLVTLASCYDREREERLTMRERNLLVKEKQFALKEAEYYALLKMRDSILAVKDTLAMISTWPEYIEGQDRKSTRLNSSHVKI